MVKISCFVCGTEKNKSPSKVYKRPCCSRQCQIELARKDIISLGEPFRITKDNRGSFWKKALIGLKANTGTKNYKWKGESVSYRGLHQWIRRKKGIPVCCSHCGAMKSTPKSIQWANIDGKYHRRCEDFISLCASCHKRHDLSLRKSIRGVEPANQ